MQYERLSRIIYASIVAAGFLLLPTPPALAVLCSPQPCVDANDDIPRAEATPDPASTKTLPLKHQALSSGGHFQIYFNTIIDDPDEGIRYSGSLTPAIGAAYSADVVTRAENDAQAIADQFECVWWLFTDPDAVDSDGIVNFLPFRRPNAPPPHGSPHLANPDAANIPLWVRGRTGSNGGHPGPGVFISPMGAISGCRGCIDNWECCNLDFVQAGCTDPSEYTGFDATAFHEFGHVQFKSYNRYFNTGPLGFLNEGLPSGYTEIPLIPAYTPDNPVKIWDLSNDREMDGYLDLAGNYPLRRRVYQGTPFWYFLADQYTRIADRDDFYDPARIGVPTECRDLHALINPPGMQFQMRRLLGRDVIQRVQEEFLKCHPLGVHRDDGSGTPWCTDAAGSEIIDVRCATYITEPNSELIKVDDPGCVPSEAAIRRDVDGSGKNERNPSADINADGRINCLDMRDLDGDGDRDFDDFELMDSYARRWYADWDGIDPYCGHTGLGDTNSDNRVGEALMPAALDLIDTAIFDNAIIPPETGLPYRAFREYLVQNYLNFYKRCFDTDGNGLCNECWDLNGNRSCDPAENSSGDTFPNGNPICGAEDCAVLSPVCWDTNANGTCELCWDWDGDSVCDPAEDTNHNGHCGMDDCFAGTPHEDTDNNGSCNSADCPVISSSCWDTNHNNRCDLCWDYNHNGVCNPDEDRNGDTVCDNADCNYTFGEDYDGDGLCTMADCCDLPSCADVFRLKSFGARYHEFDLNDAELIIHLEKVDNLPNAAYAVFFTDREETAIYGGMGETTPLWQMMEDSQDIVIYPLEPTKDKAIVIVTAFEGIWDYSPTAPPAQYLDTWGYYRLTGEPVVIAPDVFDDGDAATPASGPWALERNDSFVTATRLDIGDDPRSVRVSQHIPDLNFDTLEDRDYFRVTVPSEALEQHCRSVCPLDSLHFESNLVVSARQTLPAAGDAPVPDPTADIRLYSRSGYPLREIDPDDYGWLRRSGDLTEVEIPCPADTLVPSPGGDRSIVTDDGELIFSLKSTAWDDFHARGRILYDLGVRYEYEACHTPRFDVRRLISIFRGAGIDPEPSVFPMDIAVYLNCERIPGCDPPEDYIAISWPGGDLELEFIYASTAKSGKFTAFLVDSEGRQIGMAKPIKTTQWFSSPVDLNKLIASKQPISILGLQRLNAKALEPGWYFARIDGPFPTVFSYRLAGKGQIQKEGGELQ